MSQDVIISIFSFVFCSGVVYGSLVSRIKNLEKTIHDNKDIAERLAKIETHVDIILQKLK